MILTERLELRPLDPATAEAVRAGERGDRRWAEGFPRHDDRGAARAFLRHGDTRYGCFLIIPRVIGLAAGTIGFFGRPDAQGAAVIGYGLVEPARGHGYASEALRALTRHAFAQGGVRRLTALTFRNNPASQRVLEKAGFRCTECSGDAMRYALDEYALRDSWVGRHRR